jgi:subtilisin family serine protease
VLVANVSRRRLLVAIGLALFASAASAGAASAAPHKGAVVPDRYIVVFKPGTDGPAKRAQKLTDEHGGRLDHTYTQALKGFSARLSDQAVKQLRSEPAVKSIEPDRIVQLDDIQTTGVAWGLDRIDQREPWSLTGVHSYNDYNGGSGVHAYVLDSGIKLSHSEFAGRLGTSYDAVTLGEHGNDCNGHGTHVAGLLGGQTYGVAKKVVLHPVRVTDCNGGGWASRLIWGIDWVVRDRTAPPARCPRQRRRRVGCAAVEGGAPKVKPAVANISASVKDGTSDAVDDAVNQLILAGVTVAVSAGNDNADACNESPARVPNAITVGATTDSDSRAWFSNYGKCVDVFAPGHDIKSAGIGDDPTTAVKFDSGTSMASPFAAGVAALYVSQYPSVTPGTVHSQIVKFATNDIVTNPGTDSPNKLLYNNILEMGAPVLNCRLRRNCEG